MCVMETCFWKTEVVGWNSTNHKWTWNERDRRNVGVKAENDCAEGGSGPVTGMGRSGGVGGLTSKRCPPQPNLVAVLHHSKASDTHRMKQNHFLSLSPHTPPTEHMCQKREDRILFDAVTQFVGGGGGGGGLCRAQTLRLTLLVTPQLAAQSRRLRIQPRTFTFILSHRYFYPERYTSQ